MSLLYQVYQGADILRPVQVRAAAPRGFGARYRDGPAGGGGGGGGGDPDGGVGIRDGAFAAAGHR